MLVLSRQLLQLVEEQAHLIRSSSLRRSAGEQERHRFLSVVCGFWAERLGLSPALMSFRPVRRADHQSDVALNDGGARWRAVTSCQ